MSSGTAAAAASGEQGESWDGGTDASTEPSSMLAAKRKMCIMCVAMLHTYIHIYKRFVGQAKLC